MAPDHGDRHDPLPPVTRLPEWVWRRLGNRTRAAVAAVAVAIVAGIVVLAPKLADVRDRNAASDRRAAAAALRANRQRIVDLQRPRALSPGPRDSVSLPAVVRVRRRAALRAAMERAVIADSDARPRTTRARRVACQAAPGRDPISDLAASTGRYACTAVTSEVANAGSSGRGVLGYPYRAQLTFAQGRIALCQLAGQAAEGSLIRDARVRLSPACGG